MKLAFIFYAVTCAVMALSLTNCGVPGIPRPPSLNLAQPVSDLRAVRKGDKVFLAWTVPVGTTDGMRMKKLGVTRVCRSRDATNHDCSNSVGTVGSGQPAEEAPGKHPATQKTTANYTDQLSTALLSDNPVAELFYAVSALNQNGRTAGLSNQVAVPAVLALPPPADFRATVKATGIVLSWSGVLQAADTPELRHLYRIYRRESGTQVDIVVGEIFEASNTYSLVDHSFEWEKTYDYRTAVVQVIHVDAQPEKQFEGDDTAPVRVFAHDIFPPAVPSGLQAASSGPGQEQFVDLIWTPNTEPDLAGYNIFRHEEGGSEQIVNTGLIRTPAFRDSNVLPGHTYFYAVSAVDVRGNESARSAEAKESVR